MANSVTFCFCLTLTKHYQKLLKYLVEFQKDDLARQPAISLTTQRPHVHIPPGGQTHGQVGTGGVGGSQIHDWGGDKAGVGSIVWESRP